RLLDHQTQLFQLPKIVHGSEAVGDVGENPVHLDGPAAAWTALAAAFIHAEFHEKLGHVRHAAGLVHHDEATGTHDGTKLGKALVVDGDVQVVSRNAAAARPAR